MKEFEECVKKVLKIPYCNFEGINPKIAYEIIIGLSLMYEEYPFFSRVICSIGTMDDFIDYTNILDFSNINAFNKGFCKYDEMKNLLGKDSAYSFGKYSTYCGFYHKMPIINTQDKLNYFSLIMNDPIKKCILSEINDLAWSPYGRLGIYHEFGHLLDQFLHISNSNKLKKIINEHDIKNEISEYACTNNKELVAEAFSFYIFSKKHYVNIKSTLINEIGEFIDNEYLKFVKFKNLKFINERYNFNKKFTINEESKHANIKQSRKAIKQYIKNNHKQLTNQS